MPRCSRCCRCWRARSCMSAADVAELTEAYLILRKAENAVQMIRDEQTHSLPTEAHRRKRGWLVNMGASGLGRLLMPCDRRRARSGRAAVRGAVRRVRQTRGKVPPTPARTGWRSGRCENRPGTRAQRLSRRARSRRSRRPWRSTRNGAAYRRLDEAGRRRLHLIAGASAEIGRVGVRRRPPWCSGCCACWRRSAPARRTWRCSRSSPRRSTA